MPSGTLTSTEAREGVRLSSSHLFVPALCAERHCQPQGHGLSEPRLRAELLLFLQLCLPPESPGLPGHRWHVGPGYDRSVQTS